MSRRIPPQQFYAALNASGLEYAGLSWSGFNVFGDAASIEEVKRLQHEAGLVPELKKRIADFTVKTTSDNPPRRDY